MDEILELESSENNKDNMKKNTFTIKSVQSLALRIFFEGLSKIINNCILLKYIGKKIEHNKILKFYN